MYLIYTEGQTFSDYFCADIKAEIKAQQEKMKAAQLSGNMEELLSLFTDDFRLLPEGKPMLQGKKGTVYIINTTTAFKGFFM